MEMNLVVFEIMCRLHGIFFITTLEYQHIAGGDLPAQDPLDGNNVQNDVGIFVSRRRTRFSTATGI